MLWHLSSCLWTLKLLLETLLMLFFSTNDIKSMLFTLYTVYMA
jgi:hypothetical protein